MPFPSMGSAMTTGFPRCVGPGGPARSVPGNLRLERMFRLGRMPATTNQGRTQSARYLLARRAPFSSSSFASPRLCANSGNVFAIESLSGRM